MQYATEDYEGMFWDDAKFSTSEIKNKQQPQRQQQQQQLQELQQQQREQQQMQLLQQQLAEERYLQLLQQQQEYQLEQQQLQLLQQQQQQQQQREQQQQIPFITKQWSSSPRRPAPNEPYQRTRTTLTELYSEKTTTKIVTIWVTSNLQMWRKNY